ncbi:hypothetical protein JR316_0007647 [Psilocybe cubensis]|uniref:Uncharacterized protein n=2 Tax=Psilocybe cubensis TaxID=181762 RepID=A0A8H8CHW8_PSICU|nr:hypothetical protein JR316_0007647 [Psilocybe cubensis]KAH9479070.1 hypothetical protein JR316_0007647 [Psilocybe cubensis]
MAQYQDVSFDIPSNTFPPQSFASLFELESPKSFLEQFLAQESSDNAYLPQFQCGSSTLIPMAQYQEESFNIPSNTFHPGSFSSLFEPESCGTGFG